MHWAFAYQDEGPLTKLTNPPGLLSDWRDHYIELLLPRAHAPSQLSPSPIAINTPGLTQQLKSTIKQYLQLNKAGE